MNENEIISNEMANKLWNATYEAAQWKAKYELAIAENNSLRKQLEEVKKPEE